MRWMLNMQVQANEHECLAREADDRRQEENFINFLDTYRGKQSNLREKSCHWIEHSPHYKISCSEHSD